MADTFIPRIDEAMNHYDIRSIYSTQLGEALANEFDRNVHIVGLKAAREAAGTLFADHPGGKVLIDGAYGNDGDTLAQGMFEAAQELDEKDVPEDGRYLTVRPAQYYLLAQTEKVLNRDFGGRGSFADGNVLNVAGINIVKSNNLPQSNITTNPAGAENDYSGDFSNTVGLVHHSTAMGTVKLMDLAMEGEYQISRQGDLIVAKFAMGHDALRPEAAVELATA